MAWSHGLTQTSGGSPGACRCIQLIPRPHAAARMRLRACGCACATCACAACGCGCGCGCAPVRPALDCACNCALARPVPARSCGLCPWLRCPWQRRRTVRFRWKREGGTGSGHWQRHRCGHWQVLRWPAALVPCVARPPAGLLRSAGLLLSCWPPAQRRRWRPHAAVQRRALLSPLASVLPCCWHPCGVVHWCPRTG